MSRFVLVPAASIRERLEAAGFRLLPGFGEEVYERHHDKDGRYTIKVYSSIQRGADEARECGADAIRVTAVLITPNKTYPIFRGKRVHRTGSVEAVLDRMIERARDAYATCNQHRKRAS